MSDRLFVIRSVAYEHPKDQIKVPKVLLMPSRGGRVVHPVDHHHVKAGVWQRQSAWFLFRSAVYVFCLVEAWAKGRIRAMQIRPKPGCQAFAMSELSQNRKAQWEDVFSALPP